VVLQKVHSFVISLAFHADLSAVSEMLFDKLNKGFALKKYIPSKKGFCMLKTAYFSGLPSTA
jgi:hypothetical protein